MDDDDRLMMSLPKQQTTVSVVTSLDDRRQIVALKAKLAETESRLAAALKTVKPTMGIERSECRHYGGSLVSDNSPSITCAECGDEIDPFTVLRRIAHEETSFCYRLNGLREEHERLAKEVEQLKAKRSALTRQIRRGGDAPPAGLVGRLRTIGVGEIMMQRVGETPNWVVAARRARSMYEETPKQPDARSHGPLEDALESVLAAMEAARGDQERAPEVAPAASPQQETSNRRNDAPAGDLAPDIQEGE